MGTNGVVADGSDAGMRVRVNVRVTKGKCVRVREGGIEGGDCC